MVPEGWTKASIGDCADTVMGYAFRSEDFVDEGIPLIRMGNLYQNQLDLNRRPAFLPRKFLAEFHRFEVNSGDLVMSMTGTLGKRDYGFVVVVPPTVETCLLNQRVMKFVPKRNTEPNFLLYTLRSEAFLNVLYSFPGGTKQANLSAKQVKGIEFACPPLPEQKKIAEILSTWDRAIEVAEAQLANARKQKRALMQSLLTGKRRFPEFAGQKWREVRFEDVFSRVRRKNTVGNDNVLTISAQHGLVSQEYYFNKRVAAQDLSGYTLLQQGDFAYNKSYSQGYPLGAIKMLESDQPGVVSSLYLCFALSDATQYSREFFRHYFEAGCFNREIYKIAQEGARNHGLLNVSATDFFRAKLLIPELEEQRMIARTIGTAEVQEEIHRREILRLKTEKKALMQQLLTGKRRVTG